MRENISMVARSQGGGVDCAGNFKVMGKFLIMIFMVRMPACKFVKMHQTIQIMGTFYYV